MINMVVFDFDGTLANTAQIMMEAYNEVAPRYRCKSVGAEDIDRLRNGNMRKLFVEFGITPLKLPFLVYAIRRALKGKGEGIQVKEGMVEALRQLNDSGVKLGILTSNAKENVTAFLQKNDMTDLFLFVSSSSHLFGKHRVLRRFMKRYGLANKELAYVGDEARDVEAGKRAGAVSVGVSWGFHALPVLEESAPDFLLTQPQELHNLLNAS